MNGFLTLTKSNIQSAVIYGILTAAVTFVLNVGNAVIDHGSIYGIDWKTVLDQGAVAVIGVFVTLISLLKNLLTNAQGKFLGLWDVIPDKTEK